MFMYEPYCCGELGAVANGFCWLTELDALWYPAALACSGVYIMDIESPRGSYESKAEAAGGGKAGR